MKFNQKIQSEKAYNKILPMSSTFIGLFEDHNFYASLIRLQLYKNETGQSQQNLLCQSFENCFTSSQDTSVTERLTKTAI